MSTAPAMIARSNEQPRGDFDRAMRAIRMGPFEHVRPDASGSRPPAVATADQVKALVRSHAEGDDTQFYSVALQVAARASRGGQRKFAQELKELVDSARRRLRHPPGDPIPVTQPRGELAGSLRSLPDHADGGPRPSTRGSGPARPGAPGTAPAGSTTGSGLPAVAATAARSGRLARARR